MKGDNMISYILAWGIWTVVLGTIMLIWVMLRKKSISATKFGAYLIYAIIMICVGIVTIILNKYDGVCGILCGVIMLHVSYNDRNTYSRFTIPYIDNIETFFVGAVLICYGLIRIFCE